MQVQTLFFFGCTDILFHTKITVLVCQYLQPLGLKLNSIRPEGRCVGTQCWQLSWLQMLLDFLNAASMTHAELLEQWEDWVTEESAFANRTGGTAAGPGNYGLRQTFVQAGLQQREEATTTTCL